MFDCSHITVCNYIWHQQVYFFSVNPPPTLLWMYFPVSLVFSAPLEDMNIFHSCLPCTSWSQLIANWQIPELFCCKNSLDFEQMRNVFSWVFISWISLTVLWFQLSFYLFIYFLLTESTWRRCIRWWLHVNQHEAPVHLPVAEPAGSAPVLHCSGAGVRWCGGNSKTKKRKNKNNCFLPYSFLNGFLLHCCMGSSGGRRGGVKSM